MASDTMSETENSAYHYFLNVLLLCLTSFLLLRSIFSAKQNKLNASKTDKNVMDNNDEKLTLNLNLPPEPPSLPFLGHLHHLFSSSGLYNSLHQLATKYGPLVYLRLGSSSLLLVSSSSLASEIFKTHDVSFASRPKFGYADKILYGPFSFINAPYGDYWRFLKKVCVTELLGPHQMERSRAVRTQEVHGFLERLTGCAKRLEVVDLGDELVKLTNNVVCRMAMSTDQAGEVREILKQSFDFAGKLYVGEMLGSFKRMILWVYGKRLAALNSKFDQLLEKILKEHEQVKVDDEDDEIGMKSSAEKFTSLNDNVDFRKHGKDLMDIMLEVQNDENAPVRITRKNIKALFTDLIIAGTDTSSQTMQWVIAELIKHPHVVHKLREEINSLTGKTRLVEESDIPNLPYLEAVVKETLRLHPSSPITTRVCRESCKIQGYDIPESTPVAINLYSIMRDPKIWTDPDEFRPERFVGSKSGGLGIKSQRAEFVPFGAGRRGCPGSLLAMTLMNYVVGVVVQCFDWEIETNVDMKPGSGMSLAMARSLKCRPVLVFNPFYSQSI